MAKAKRKAFRTAYDEHKRYTTDWLDENGEREPGMTEQHHKTDCDIASILKKYDSTGIITHTNNAIANYGDFSDIKDYKESLNKIMQAQDSFMELPSQIRKKFGNDPGNYLEFVTNPDNKEEMIKLGLAIQEKEVTIPKVEIVNSPTETDG